MSDSSGLSPLKRAFLALEEMKAKLDALEQAAVPPIAVIGVGCRFPGDADSPDAFWRLLLEGGDGIKETPRDRWDVDALYDPDPNAPGKMYTRWGGYLSSVDRFDPQFFGISPREAVSMDPQQRLLLEVSWEALEHAGQSADRLVNSLTGVFVGICTSDYATLQMKYGRPDEIDAYQASGSAHSIASGRLSYVLGLQGPSVSIDTACSSSLVAVHLACQSLRTRECRMALAGGVHLTLSPENTIGFCKSRMLASDGHCKTFDAKADGFAEGEGCGIVVLKRLADAVADGDRVLAVIRGSAVNQDGPSSGLTAPNGPSQEAVIRAALAMGKVAPEQVSYVEAHGTGTSLGDPIELQALASSLRGRQSGARPLLIGSVKTNFGHLEAASGVAGLIKVVLSLERGTIPPHRNFHVPNPHVPWSELPLSVVTSASPWPAESGTRIAGVSAFGFSGTNAHIVLERAPEREVEKAVERPVQTVTLSAKSEDALRSVARRLADRLAADDSLALADVAYSANAGRAHLSDRIALVAASRVELQAMLQAVAAGETPAGASRGRVVGSDRPKIAFLFTGQGSQYAGMARELTDVSTVFRQALNRCDELFRPHLSEPLLSVLHSDDDKRGLIDQTAYTQAALFSIEYALAELWQSWGITPAAVMGHSVGEYVAAVVAGALTLEGAVTLVAARGRLMQAQPPGGAMAAVFADAARVGEELKRLGPRVSIAAVNGPENTVISGERAAVDAAAEAFTKSGIRVEPLTVSHAFHSPLMDPILDEFERIAATVPPAPPRIALASNLTGEIAQGDFASPAYWRRHLREGVQFAGGINTLLARGIRTFVEIGPSPVLAGMAQRFVADPAAVWLPSIRRGRGEWMQLLQTLGALYARGAEVNWEALHRDESPRKVALPTYPFQRERYWIDTGGDGLRSATRSSNDGAATHPLLGRKIRSASRDVLFEASIAPRSIPFLADHRKRGRIVFPATGYFEMARAAAAEIFGRSDVTVDDLVMFEPLVIGEDDARTVQLVATPGEAETAEFRIFSLDPDSGASAQWIEHATGTLRAGIGTATVERSLNDLRTRLAQEIPAADYYQKLEAEGHDYGPAFRGLRRIWPSSNEVLAEIELPEAARGDRERYAMHPALIDAALQLLGATAPPDVAGAESRGPYLPVSIDRVAVRSTGLHRLWSYTRARTGEAGSTAQIVDVRMFDDAGAIVAEVEGMRLQPISGSALRIQARERDKWLHEIDWRVKRYSQPNAERLSPSHWMILADEQGAGAAIADRLRARGDAVVIVRPSSSADFEKVCRDAVSAHGAPRGVIHLWSLDAGPVASAADLERAQQAGCKSLLQVVQGLTATLASDLPRLSVVTRGARQITGSDPDLAVAQAPILGLAATVSAEHPGLRCTQIDLDSQESIDADVLWREIEACDGEDRIALRGGSRYVARLVRQSQASSGEVASASTAASSEVLDIPSPGVLDHLAWKPASRRAPGPGEVEIEVVATGLNFRDVLTALGMYEGAAGPLGTECAGRIVRIGEGVGEFQLGDEVIAFAGDTFRTFVTLPVDVVTRRPKRLGLVEAATIPATFLTAHHALHHLAQMSAGDRVLIHAAAGGVGLAAVQLARRAGAEIFATAGSDEKREYLRSLGVRHVMNSRTLDFADEVMKLTGGKGVDIVLNSLAGEFIPRSLAALGANGRFLEIGKKGIWTREQMAAARRDVAYHAIYLGELEAAQIRAMFEELVPAFETGALTPLRHRVFERNRAVDAFRHMAQARHIGKIVITHPAAMRAADTSAIRDDATYLVTGGFGALGSHIARWLVASGARQVALMGRHTETSGARTLVGELESTGARVIAVQGDVAREDDVARLLQTIRSTNRPLRGVIHAAGVVDDGTLAQQDWPRFEKVMAPKMLGAWHLHSQTQADPLDFFVCFSSMVSVFASPGQGNYAAANSFLDALAHQRRAHGLPALSINWGPWAGSGMADAVAQRHQQRWAAQGVDSMAPDDGLAMLHRLLREPSAQVAVLPVRWSTLLGAYQPGTIPPLLSELERATPVEHPRAKSGTRRDLRGEIERTAPANRRSAVLGEIRALAAKVLSLDRNHAIDARQPLSELGLDSLMAVELRNSIGELAGKTLPATLLFKYPTIGALTDYVLEDVFGLGETEPETASTDVDKDAAVIQPLDEDEVKRLLYEELKALGSES